MYSRFKSLESFEEKELEKLKSSTAAVVGLGATGSVMAEHLARHGVNLIIIDRDYLEENDLYSSNLYKKDQCEKSLPKAKAAEQELEDLTEVESHVESLKSGNIQKLEQADIILDGTDNLETRFLLNEFSKKEGIPWIYTAAIADKGYSMLFKEKCFSCVFEKIKAGSLETCETAGILRETSSIAASMSALKAVELLAGKEPGEMLETVEGESFEVQSSGCSVCEDDKYEYLNSQETISTVCGENKYQLKKEVSEEGFEKLRKSGEVIADNEYLLRVMIDGNSFTLFQSGRAIIEAEDEGHAESLFSEVVGI